MEYHSFLITALFSCHNIYLFNSITVHKIKPDTRLRTATTDFSPLLPSGDPLNFIIDVTGPRGVSIT